MSGTINRITNWFLTPVYHLNKGAKEDSTTLSKLACGEYVGIGAGVLGIFTALTGRSKDNTLLKTIGAALGISGALVTLWANQSKISPELSSTEQDPSDSTSGTSGVNKAAAYKAKMTVDTASLDRWSSWRVLVDTIQNHTDEVRIQKAKLWTEGREEEAKALRADICILLKSGKTISIYDPQFNNVKYDDVKEIIISDLGQGYDRERLEMIWSTGKTNDENSQYLNAYNEMGINPPGGKFGEGLKMVAASILKTNLDQENESIPEEKRIGLTYRSQNWEGKLVGKHIKTKSGQSTTASEFNVVENNKEIQGSQSIIHNPTEEMFNLIKNAETLCTDFAPPQTQVANNYYGIAFESDHPLKQIYVRGYRVSTLNPVSDTQEQTKALFNYDLRDININRDRDQLDHYDLRTEAGKILLFSSNESTITKLIEESETNPSYYKALSGNDVGGYDNKSAFEFEALYEARYYASRLSDKEKELWRNVFYKKYGEDAILSSSSDFSNDSSKQAQAAKEKLVVLNIALFKIFEACGIQTDLKYTKETVKDYQLGLSIDYEKDRWGPLRVVLENLQNHLDAARKYTDLYGNPTFSSIEFQVKGKEEWLPLSQLPQVKNEEVASIRFKDESYEGFPHGHLAQFGSEKKKSSSVQIGQFGEGLKIAAAASLRLGLNVSHKSRDWTSDAYIYENNLGADTYKNLAFRIYKSPKITGSETIIYLGDNSIPSTQENFNEVINIVRNLNQYVLRHKELGLSDKNPLPLHSCPGGSIISSDKGDVYVKDFYITSEEKDKLIFSYNFNNLETNRDRDIVSSKQLSKAVEDIISSLNNKELIKAIIQKAVKDPHGKYHEFQDLSFKSELIKNKDLWASVFTELYGNKAVLSSGEDNAAQEAQFAGYNVFNVNKNIARTLHSCGILYDHEVTQADYELLDESKLTDQEKAVLSAAQYLDENQVVFPDSNVPTEYKVYECAKNRHSGKEMPGVLGFCDIRGRRLIGIKRSALQDPKEFLEVYSEEKAHQLSGASDATREHFNKAIDAIRWLMFKFQKRADKVLEALSKAFEADKLAKLFD